MDNLTAIGVAIIAAAAGLGGAFLGVRVAARATLQAAERAQEAARVARFADRIRELGGIVLDSAYRFTEAVNEGKPTANLGEDAPRQIRELRLIVRHDPTGLVLDDLLNTLYILDDVRVGGEDESDPGKLRGGQVIESRDLQQKLESALRSELEMTPLPRRNFDW